MAARPPFVTDPYLLAQLEGSRYVVLRPLDSLARRWNDLQTMIRERLDGKPVAYPSSPHGILRVLPAGADTDALLEAVAAWAGHTNPLLLDGEGIGSFPAPNNAVFLRLRKSGELAEAFDRLSTETGGRGLPEPPYGELPAEQWTFHLSLAYCERVDEPAWLDLLEYLDGLSVLPASCLLTDVEVAAVGDGEERIVGAYRLGAFA